jgi:hypothetical protein
MRYRLMATYRGVPYEAGIGPTDEDVVLFAACPPPEELGFEPATGHWRKQLRLRDVQALWESRPMGTFRGGRCIVLDDLGDRLHIAYLGHDAYQAEQLGYWEVDRGVFELITPRDEVSEIVEERLDYPSRPAAPEPLAETPAAAASPAATPPPPAEFAVAAAAANNHAAPAASGPGSAESYLTGPHAARPQANEIHLTGPHAARPPVAEIHLTGPHAARISVTGPHAVTAPPAEPRLTGPHAVRPPADAPATAEPSLTGPRAVRPPADAPATAEPSLTGPHAVRPPADTPATAEPSLTGPHAAQPPAVPPAGTLPAAVPAAAVPPAARARAVGSHATRPDATGSHGARPDAAGPGPMPDLARPDPAEIPPDAEPALPLEAAARRAASARGAQPAGPPEPEPRPEPRPRPEPGSPRRRRSSLRRDATQRIFSELAGLAAIPPSAYAVGEEVDGAMCLIQTGDGFEVFNAAAGSRHEVRIFDDEESAYFYLFGVLAAEAVRTGRLAPQG